MHCTFNHYAYLYNIGVKPVAFPVSISLSRMLHLGKSLPTFFKLIVPMYYLFLMRNLPSLTSSASVLFPFFPVCFVLQLPQDPVSDPGVCVADIKAKLYLYFVLRHRQSPPLPEGKNRASSLFILSLTCYMYDSPLWKMYKNLQGNLCL